MEQVLTIQVDAFLATMFAAASFVLFSILLIRINQVGDRYYELHAQIDSARRTAEAAQARLSTLEQRMEREAR